MISGGNPAATIDALIVAGDERFRADFAKTVGTRFAVAGTASLDRALSEIECGLRPRLLIIEAAAMHLGTLQRIRSKVRTAKTVVLIDPDQAMPPAEPAQYDVDGYIPTDMSPETLQVSLGLILAGQAVMPSRLASAMHYGRTIAMPPFVRRCLTPRECDILRLVSLGKMTKEIARALGLSPATVKFEIKILCGKLAVRTRAEAAIWAIGQLSGSIGVSRLCLEGNA
jgi:two-component system, NarL family, nitrate/nitrite response regulator NarL